MLASKVKVKVLASKLTDKTWRGVWQIWKALEYAPWSRPRQSVMGEEHAVLLRKHSAGQGVEG